MRGFATVQALGNVGRDPEVRYTAAGKAVASFSLACNEKRGGEEKTEWVNVIAWEKTAEIAQQYLKKGSPVHISGRLQTRKWEKNGVTRYTTEVVVDRLTLLGSRQEQAQNEPSKERHVPDEFDTFDPNDDVPFSAG